MSTERPTVGTLQQVLLVVLRFAIGWHLFYQGFGKLVAVHWTSQGYLRASHGPLAGLFQWIGESPTLVAIADFTTIWGLMILGVLLMIGLLTRWAALGGAVLLFLFYAAVPPLDLTGFVVPNERGTELYVNQTLLEVLTLLLIAAFPTGHMIGLDILTHHWRKKS